MDRIYFQDWSATELRVERKAIEGQILTGALRVSYSGGGAADFLPIADAKALVRLISNRIAEIEGRKPTRTGLRFWQLTSGE